MENSEWEKQFDEIQNKTKYTEYTDKRFCCGGDYCEGDHLGFIKSFIRSTLLARDEEWARYVADRFHPPIWDGMTMRPMLPKEILEEAQRMLKK